jgi:D-cysteine desulfhydrase
VRPAGRSPPIRDVLPETGRLPFTPLLHGPTPVEEIRGLEAYFGRGGVWVKRDDLSSPVYGGNKIRKYEYVLGEAETRGATRLVTTGGIASTQVTATAVLGRALGYDVTAIFFDQPMTRFGQRAILADQAAGAELVWGGSYLGAAARSWAVARRQGSYFILPGASTPLPNVGYVDAALELVAQVEASGAPRPGVVVVPAGSCGTVVGLAIGFALAGWETEVVGVRITTRLACNAAYLYAVTAATERYLAALSPTYRRARGAMGWRSPRARLFHGAAGPGYGEPTAEAIEGASLLARITGHGGEITYTGKALAALRTLCRSEEHAGKTLLLWNTLTGEPPSLEGSDEARLPAALRRALGRPVVA